MNKIDAIKKLNELISRLNSLPHFVDGGPNHEFDKWKRNCKLAIKKIFDESYVEEFSKIKFVPSMIYLGMDRSDFIKGHNKGREKAKAKLESFIEEIEDYWDEPTIDNTSDFKIENTKILEKSKVFIVHGHDELAKTEIARYLEKLNIEPIILHEQASESKTVIEKIEKYGNEVGFAVVLYTECDVGGKCENTLQSRARQNVILEHGYFIAHLGRKNTCALVKGKVETPSDISGVVYVPMNDSSWHLDLAKELKSSGYEIDFNKLF